MFILNLTSSVITLNDGETEYRRTDEKNKAYLEVGDTRWNPSDKLHCFSQLCKIKHGNDRYVERSMQTFNNLSKQAYVNTDALLIQVNPL